MTWKHIAAIALAVALVMACSLSHACSTTPDTFHGVLQLASSIAAFAGGNAMMTKPDNKPQDKE